MVLGKVPRKDSRKRSEMLLIKGDDPRKTTKCQNNVLMAFLCFPLSDRKTFFMMFGKVGRGLAMAKSIRNIIPSSLGGSSNFIAMTCPRPGQATVSAIRTDGTPTHHLLPAYYLLPTTYYLLPTTYYLLDDN